MLGADESRTARIAKIETFEKCSILFTFKEGDPALAGLTTEPETEIEQSGAFCKGFLNCIR